MKNPEELKALKEELEALDAKLAELSEDELKEVTGGLFLGKAPAGMGMDMRPRKPMQIVQDGKNVAPIVVGD